MPNWKADVFFDHYGEELAKGAKFGNLVFIGVDSDK